MKAWTAIDKLSIIWKSDLTDKMRRSFFQVEVVLILLYGCTTLMLTKLYSHLPPITKTIQVRRVRHAGHCWRSRDKLKVMYSNGDPHMAEQKQDSLLEHTYSSSVRIWDVALKTCQKRWTIGRNGKRESGISVLAAWYEDEDIVNNSSQV